MRIMFLGDTLRVFLLPQRETPQNPIIVHIGFQKQVLMSNETQFEFIVGEYRQTNVHAQEALTRMENFTISIWQASQFR